VYYFAILHTQSLLSVFRYTQACVSPNLTGFAVIVIVSEIFKSAVAFGR